MAKLYDQRLKLGEIELKNIREHRLKLENGVQTAEVLDAFSIENILKDIKKTYDGFRAEMHEFCVKYCVDITHNQSLVRDAEIYHLYERTESQKHKPNVNKKLLADFKTMLEKKLRFMQAKINELNVGKAKMAGGVQKSFLDALKLLELTKKEANQRNVVVSELMDIQLKTENEM